jgi:hypothetical protein
MDLLEKFAPKKKKTLVSTNVRKRAVGRVLYTRQFCVFEYGMEEHTYLQF